MGRLLLLLQLLLCQEDIYVIDCSGEGVEGRGNGVWCECLLLLLPPLVWLLLLWRWERKGGNRGAGDTCGEGLKAVGREAVLNSNDSSGVFGAHVHVITGVECPCTTSAVVAALTPPPPPLPYSCCCFLLLLVFSIEGRRGLPGVEQSPCE